MSRLNKVEYIWEVAIVVTLLASGITDSKIVNKTIYLIATSICARVAIGSCRRASCYRSKHENCTSFERKPELGLETEQ